MKNNKLPLLWIILFFTCCKRNTNNDSDNVKIMTEDDVKKIDLALDSIAKLRKPELDFTFSNDTIIPIKNDHYRIKWERISLNDSSFIRFDNKYNNYITRFNFYINDSLIRVIDLDKNLFVNKKDAEFVMFKETILKEIDKNKKEFIFLSLMEALDINDGTICIYKFNINGKYTLLKKVDYHEGTFMELSKTYPIINRIL